MQSNVINFAAVQDSTLSQVDSSKNKASAAALSQDFETFLQMLTVQLENQDPLNPVEASDYAVQLATFSGVEQQVKTNDLLANLGEQIAQQNFSQYAGWIGHDIRHTGNVHFDGNPVSVVATFSDDAEKSQLVVRNNADQEIRRIDLAAQGDVTWDGLDGQGMPAALGTYRLYVESFVNEQSIGTSPVEAYATIVESQVKEGAMEFVLSDGSRIVPAEVVALR